MDVKKSALALLALGLTGVATAGGFMPAPACNNQPVTVPCERSAWDLGVTTYWLRPANDEVATDKITVSSPDIYVYAPADHKFGFGLEGSYHWGTGNSVVLDWLHYDRRFTNEYSYLNNNSRSYSTSAADYDLDTVSLNLVQRLDVGANWDADIRFGADYVRFDQKILYSTSTLAQVKSGTYTGIPDISKFRGLGPQAGLDAQYNVGNGFGIVGRSAVSLLVGDLKAIGITGATYVNNVITSSSATYLTGKHHAVVAAFDGKVGVNYVRPFQQGSLMLEGGYTASKFVNMVISTHRAFLDDHNGDTHVFSLDGWYATLKYTS